MGKTAKEFEYVIISGEYNVATITLNRPKVFNAISPELIAEANPPPKAPTTSGL